MRRAATRIAFVLAATAVAGCIAGGAPAPFGDPRAGEALGRQWCAGCHQVAADQPRPKAAAPSFAEVAGRREFDAAGLRAFLAEEHLPMPTFRLRPDEREDLIAYFAALGRR